MENVPSVPGSSRDIDPDSISLQEKTGTSSLGEYVYGVFSARTTNGESKIKEEYRRLPTGKMPLASGQHMISVVTFVLNMDFGPKFYEAFKQVVILANRQKNETQ